MIDKWSILPISACVYVSIVAPLISFASPHRYTLKSMLDSNWENRIFWPVMAASAVGLAILNRSHLGKRPLPPHIICLLVYLAFAGASVLWSFRPELSFIRFTQQAMILTTIILPAMLAVRTADTMRSLFLCFAFGSILNVLLLHGSQLYINGMPVGYQGYLEGKNALGQFAAVAVLLAFHEMLYSGLRRALGIIIVVIAGILLFLSNSKASIGFAFLAPFLAGFTLMIRKRMGISPMIVLLIIITLSVYFRDKVSWFLFHDLTFTGRTLIWDFAVDEIRRNPVLGWGYQSFWLVGLDAPSIVEAPGWVKGMPNAHNGYLDTMLEMGLVGFACLVTFIMATLHAIGRLADRDPARAWLMLSLAIFIIFHNLLESTWMHGGDLLWVVFAFVAAELGRWWRLHQLIRVTYGSRPSRPASFGLSGGLGPLDSHKNPHPDR
jgi:O-antigen ligase